MDGESVLFEHPKRGMKGSDPRSASLAHAPLTCSSAIPLRWLKIMEILSLITSRFDARLSNVIPHYFKCHIPTFLCLLASKGLG